MFTLRLKFCFVLLLCLAIPLAVNAQTEPEPVARVIIFYSPTCRHCHEVLTNVLPPLQDHYGSQLAIRMYDLSAEDDYSVFMALRERYPDVPNSVPQLYIGQHILVGTDQIRDQLPGLIDECLASGGCDWTFSVGAEAGQAGAAANSNPVYLAYCYDPTCLECDRVTYDLEHLQGLYPNLVVQRFNIRDDAALIEAMCERYGVPEAERLVAPAVFIGDSHLTAGEITPEQLNTLVAETGTTTHVPPWDGLDAAAIESAAANIASRFGGFSVLAVAAAGLLDGVNPCAFTTIIFFISYLALVGREKRDILLVGAAFTLAVFLTYTAMGLGLAALIDRLGAIGEVGKLVYLGTAFICAGLALVSLWDYFKIRQGKLSEIALQLPKSLKNRIHQTIRSSSRMRGYVAAAFGAGVLVSVFELACTGQVYLPTIVFMTSVAQMRWSALAYLVLYNLLFVVPLVVVFMVTYQGIKSQRLTAVFQDHAGAVKLLTAGLFGALALWLAYMLLA